MARVVQRRGGPPYLLVVFVFVALIATTLAVIFYIGKEDAAQKGALETKARKRAELDAGTYKNTIAPKLIEKMTGAKEAMVLKDVLEEVERDLDLEHSKGAGNLGEAVRSLNQKVTDNLTRIKQLQDSENSLIASLKAQEQAVRDLKAKYDTDTKQVTGERDADRRDFANKLRAKDDQLNRTTAAHTKKLAGRDQQITAQAQELDRLKRELQVKDVQSDELKEIIREQKGTAGDPGIIVMRKADGKVVKVLPEEKICYISLGEKDNVKAGVPFAVYSPKEGIPGTGRGVAKIMVINVGQISSECRITEWDKDHPISEGYLVANLVFNITRTYSFVVQGEFDLYSEGRADPEAGRKIRKFIEGFGGKVEDKVGVTTDFVIMGAEPLTPPKPAEDQPAAWAAYNTLLKKVRDYQSVKTAAESLRIPVLNTNRFLAFTGYVPRRRLVD